MPKGRKKKKVPQQEEDSSVPRSFVFHRGTVGKSVLQLESDMRHMMGPFTASHLKVRKNNVLKDFVHVAGPLGVTHFMILSKTEIGTYLRLARLPRGPTLTFKANQYSLAKDILALLKRPRTFENQYKKPPLLVLNGFSTDTLPMKLMTTMFQNIFPSINIHKIQLGEIQRCVLLNYDPETKTIELRHYNIKAAPVGMSRGVKKLIQTRIPNLSKLDDISDYVLGGGCGYGSESEGEEPADSKVTLPQKVPGRGNIKAQKSAIRLTELGPRLTLQLVKIEDGLCSGEVLYHEYITKSEAEVKALKEKREKTRKLKEARKKKQEENVKRKEKEKELNKERSIAGQKLKAAQEKGDDEDYEKDALPSDNDDDDDDDIDDRTWYKNEVGAEPDQDILLSNNNNKKSKQQQGEKRKRQNDDSVSHKKHKKEKHGKGSEQMEKKFKKPSKLSKRPKMDNKRQGGKSLGKNKNRRKR